MAEFKDTDDYTWRTVEMHRAVVQLKEQYEHADSQTDFLDRLDRVMEQHMEFQEIFGAIVKAGVPAFKKFREEIVKSHSHGSNASISDTYDIIPELFTNVEFQNGLTVGLAASYLTARYFDHPLITTHMHDILAQAEGSPQEFASAIGKVGLDTFEAGMVHPNDPAYAAYRDKENPLSEFAWRVSGDRHDNPKNIYYFKVGVGLAQRAYLGYCRDITDQLGQIETHAQ